MHDHTHARRADDRAGERISPEELLEEIGTASGIVTGIPSLRDEQGGGILQTLDKLVKGISVQGNEKEYALVVLADPADDTEISLLQQKLLQIKGEVHTLSAYTASESRGRSVSWGESSSNNLNAGAGGMGRGRKHVQPHGRGHGKPGCDCGANCRAGRGCDAAGAGDPDDRRHHRRFFAQLGQEHGAGRERLLVGHARAR